VTPREGKVCNICGLPVGEAPGGLCAECHAWQPISEAADRAIDYSKTDDRSTAE
jgi:predicted ATP-dependent serine protease